MKQLKTLLLVMGISVTQLGVSAAGASNSRADRALVKAARTGDLALVQQALEAGANVNAAVPDTDTIMSLPGLPGTRHNGKTALFLACSMGHTKMVEFLLESGANLNQLFLDYFTTLYHTKTTTYGE